MHVSDVGTLALQLAWCLAVWGIGASIYGARAGRSELVASGRPERNPTTSIVTAYTVYIAVTG